MKLALLGNAALLSVCILQNTPLANAKAKLFPFTGNGLYAQIARRGFEQVLAMSANEKVLIACESGLPQLKAIGLRDSAQQPAGRVYYIDCITAKPSL